MFNALAGVRINEAMSIDRTTARESIRQYCKALEAETGAATATQHFVTL
jgi:hypothetical protein